MLMVVGVIGLFVVLGISEKPVTWRTYAVLVIGCAAVVCAYAAYQFVFTAPTPPTIESP